MARAGMNAETGALIEGWDDCAQSIGIILTTRVGSRVMRRAFGSDLRSLQDRNPDPRLIMLVFVAIASALRRWEPSFRLSRIHPERVTADGVGVFRLTGTFYPRGHLGDTSVAEPRELALGHASGVWRPA